ncbi:PREDICTED: guanylate-binding protein 1 isoform X2 [Tarenaya hassleriana]|uniref:guanylate-binding protein 1 isoform X1 n=1 Tax=Tarenaya hassleriana TaxID=28532 RepID=UPI00053C50A0|nr:PREDICTED: guanylate-binding protein 1 isoform X1 [Tarenaya hassleriana]XP_010518779.1 PREDICTED: guanylate-binding protein 1 isoform X2 [Tarenaya hassleriana]
MMRIFGRGGKDSPSDSASPSSESYPSPPSAAAASSSPVTGPARPIRLVYCDEKGKFRMDPEAVAALQLVKEPIGVVSVCGRARQGKSFILNQLLGRSSGFQVASTHKPCTKGLWLWSAPLKRTALDGTEYNLLLLDSEGIDAYDQTGTYSTQIFSLAVLLSSMFIYNQMGGIDEAALDRLSLVTEMTKHIRIKASGGKSSASELGQFSPIFVWLLRDFYLDLVEDNQKITPRDYLELALRPVQGGGKDIAAKNEIRDSIQALFPDRECFTLVRPLSNERELQRLDQISLDKLRPEFRAGLDALTKFVFERTRPKQVGPTVMTGPILVGVTQSYLDALNKGAVPTITSSWQSVEEAECRRAYDSGAEAYMSAFDRSKPPEEGMLREAHEEAVQKALAVFSASAVGAGSARKKYDDLLQKFFKKAFEDYKRNAFMEADLRCRSTIQSMEKRLRAACHASDASIDNVVKVLEVLFSEYDASCHGPGKWQKLAVFLQQSLEGPIYDLTKRLIDNIASEKSSLVLKCRSVEDKMKLLSKQLEDSEKYKSEYQKRYDDAINDKRKLADEYTNRITNLQGDNSSLKERCSTLLKTLDSAKQEITEWKRKYDQIVLKQKAVEDQVTSEIEVLRSRSTASEARLAAAREQAKSAQEETKEWKRKCEFAVNEAKSAFEKASSVQERSSKETQLREDALREEFNCTLVEKEEETREKATKLEQAEQSLTTLRLELKAAESKLESFDVETSSLKLEIRELVDKLESANTKVLSYEREALILEQEKIHLEQKYQSEFQRFDEDQKRCRAAEREAKHATELADKARAEAVTAQKEKSEIQRLAMERLAKIERAERQMENLERQKTDMEDELSRLRVSEMEAVSKVAVLEARVEEREKEIESLLKKSNEQRAHNVKSLEKLLDEEREAHIAANRRAEGLSHELQAAQANLDQLQQELAQARLKESALDNKIRATASTRRKRTRTEEEDDTGGVGSDMETSEGVNTRSTKKTRSSAAINTQTEESGQSQQNNGEEEDYRKFTVQRLKQELTKHDFGHLLLNRGNLNKKEILALYETHLLQKS